MMSTVIQAALLLTPVATRAAEPTIIRLNVQPGHLLRYNLNLAGQSAWSPQLDNVSWGQMKTDFTFALRAKTLRQDGSCTFELFGEDLRSSGETDKGKIDVQMTRQTSKVKARGGPRLRSTKSPLERPMTVTLGPQGRFRFGTGLGPLVIYMLPHVDHRFWTLLTVAPNEPVAVGDKWDEEFEVAVPGAEGKPLTVRAKWEALDRKRSRSYDILTVALAAQIDLKDSAFILKNGDRIHVVQGRYFATGKAQWNVDRGLLHSATARQQLLITADQPTRRALRSETTSSLRLVKEQPPAGQ
jgi:hypothetical protein